MDHKKYIIAIVLVLFSFFILRKLTHHPPVIKSLKEGNVLNDFEDQRIWSTSPERGFSLKLSGQHKTEGRHSLEVVYPKGVDFPSINTRRFDQEWGDYDYFAIDIFNPQKDPVDFTIRLDDQGKQRVNIPYLLQPGLNKVKSDRAQI